MAEDMDIVMPGEDDDECRIPPIGQPSNVRGQGNGGRFRNGDSDNNNHRRMVDITRDKPIKVTIKVVVPVRDHPKFNFVGKLLGPKGNSLKRLQEETMTKMAILGRGSMRDRHKEEELRSSGDPRFTHLLDELHVEITAFAAPAEAHARIAYALSEVRRFLVPDYNDEIRQEQMWEMQLLSSGNLSSVNGHKNTEKMITTENEEDMIINESSSMSSPIITDQDSIISNAVSKAITGVNNNNTLFTKNGINYGTCSSTGSLTPPEFPLCVTTTPVLLPHSTLRDIQSKQSSLTPTTTSGGNMAVGRKRPLLTSAAAGTNKLFMSPSKRTVLSLLARAKAAQSKDILSPYSHHHNITDEGIASTLQTCAKNKIQGNILFNQIN